MGVNDGCRHPSDPEACAHGGAEPLSDQPQVIRWSLPLNPALPPKQRDCMAFPAEKPLQRKGLSTRGGFFNHGLCAHWSTKPLSYPPQVITWSPPLNPALPNKQMVCMALTAEKLLQRKRLSTLGGFLTYW